MNTTKTAQEIKDFLVQLAVNDKLPSDLTQLPVEGIEQVLNESIKQFRIDNEENERIERASIFLCEGELSIKEQLALIDAQAEIDDTMTLDNVHEEVIVWEKVEYSFSVRSFLEEIDRYLS